MRRHGTSQLYHSVRSLRDLHSLGACGPQCVNPVETSTSWYNLYINIFAHRFTTCGARFGSPQSLKRKIHDLLQVVHNLLRAVTHILLLEFKVQIDTELLTSLCTTSLQIYAIITRDSTACVLIHAYNGDCKTKILAINMIQKLMTCTFKVDDKIITQVVEKVTYVVMWYRTHCVVNTCSQNVWAVSRYSNSTSLNPKAETWLYWNGREHIT